MRHAVALQGACFEHVLAESTQEVPVEKMARVRKNPFRAVPVGQQEQVIENFWVEDVSDVRVSMRQQRGRLGRNRTLQSVHFVVDCLRGSAIVLASLLVRRELRG